MLYATEDGWNDGPLPFACEFAPNKNDGCDPDTVLLFRDGGPTCPPFFLEEVAEAVNHAGEPALGALRFVRNLRYEDGIPAFEDGHQAAGLLLAVLGQEGR